MTTSRSAADKIEPLPNATHTILAKLDEDVSNDHSTTLPSQSIPVQSASGGVAQGPKITKLSARERLNRLPGYRIPPFAIGLTKNSVGRGGKAQVGRATSYWRGQREVAAKMLQYKDGMDKKKFANEFVHEVETLARLSHENIVRLVGFVEDLEYDKAWIALSWEPNGNVREFLASGKWEIPERISLIRDMFRGLKYLHTRQPPICHGDLKSLNILVSSSYHAVITDFGSARALGDTVNQTTYQGAARNASEKLITSDENTADKQVTIVANANQLTLTGPVWSLRWAAPELVKEEEQPGLASDIWSAGWVCWEIMTDKVPFEELKRDCAVMLKVIQGTVPSVREDAQLVQVIRLCSMMKECWNFEPKNRPNVTQCWNDVKWMPSVPPSDRTAEPDDPRQDSPLIRRVSEKIPPRTVTIFCGTTLRLVGQKGRYQQVVLVDDLGG